MSQKKRERERLIKEEMKEIEKQALMKKGAAGVGFQFDLQCLQWHQ